MWWFDCRLQLLLLSLEAAPPITLARSCLLTVDGCAAAYSPRAKAGFMIRVLSDFGHIRYAAHSAGTADIGLQYSNKAANWAKM